MTSRLRFFLLLACSVTLWGSWLAIPGWCLTIEGYTDAVSYSQGDTINFYLSSDRSVTHAPLSLRDVNQRLISTLSVDVSPQSPTTAEPWKDGFGFTPTFQYQIPEVMASGSYWLDSVKFFVKRASKASDIAILHPTNTVNAYTTSGGKSLYGGESKAMSVSYQRPQRNYSNTLPFDRWMLNQDYDYRYLTDSDMEDYSEVSGSKLLIVTGGAEYWTREARQNFDRFINEGGNVLVVAGNTMNRPVAVDDPMHPTQMTELREDPMWKAMWNDAWLQYPTLDSLAGDFYWVGYGYSSPNNGIDLGWDGWKIIDDPVPYLAGTGVH